MQDYLLDNSILTRLGRILTADFDEKTLSPCKVVTLADVLTSLTTTMGAKRKRDYDKRKQDLIDREAKGRMGEATHKLFLSATNASSKRLMLAMAETITDLRTYEQVFQAMATYNKSVVLGLLADTYRLAAGIVPEELGLDKTLRACLAFHDEHTDEKADCLRENRDYYVNNIFPFLALTFNLPVKIHMKEEKGMDLDADDSDSC